MLPADPGADPDPDPDADAPHDVSNRHRHRQEPLMIQRRTVLTVAAALGASAVARAQAPASAAVLTLMVPFPAGGVSDLYARAVAPRMAKDLGSTVIVENLPGASGSLAVAKALGRAAIGDMLVVGSPTEMILAPATLQSARYKPENFRPLALLSRSQLALYARADLPPAQVDELVAWAKANPDKPLTYGSVGVGSIYHLAGQAFADAVGVPMNHVPYKGGAPLLQDLAGGHIDLVLLPANGDMARRVATGRPKALAVTGQARSPIFPNVPTFAESRSMPNFTTVDSWVGLFIPAAAPPAQVQALTHAVLAALGDADVQQQLLALAGTPPPPPAPAAQLATFYATEIERYTQAIRKANLQPS
ncbi:MAG: tripartite tricarboxylate transporter substrate binding protein [Proteobacteria bacterium]|nr:tripartite tricarboxylate transporter substrate binding protein [Pseudomonadota bacterium]